MAAATESKPRRLQVQFRAAEGEWEIRYADMPADLDSDDVVIQQFIPGAPHVEWERVRDDNHLLYLREKVDAKLDAHARSEGESWARVEQIRAEMRAETPQGYRFGDERRLIRDIAVVVPIRYSDGVTDEMRHPIRINLEYRIGDQKRRPFRIGPLTVDGVSYPWPGPMEELTPGQFELRFGDQVPGVPEVRWPEEIQIEYPSPAAQLAARAKPQARRDPDDLSEAELRAMPQLQRR